jgi:hypothetical protein
MSEPLEELRAQRALIQKHLDWLDAQIQRAEGSADQPSASTGQPAVKSLAKDAIETPPGQTPKAASQTPVEPIPDMDELTPPASGGSDLRRAQIGCFAFFAISTLLFLFLLFGLPYLMN